MINNEELEVEKVRQEFKRIRLEVEVAKARVETERAKAIKNGKNRSRKKIEGIEGEIVYLIRNETDNWPKYQIEIHFHNIPKRERAVASSIYKKIKNL